MFLTSFKLYKDVLTLERVGCLFPSLLVKSTFLEKNPDHVVEEEEEEEENDPEERIAFKPVLTFLSFVARLFL